MQFPAYLLRESTTGGEVRKHPLFTMIEVEQQQHVHEQEKERAGILCA
jgi:hypothetical protein